MQLVWLRRDLRLDDHAALAAAVKRGPVALVFVFDTAILQCLSRNDHRVVFIYQVLQQLYLTLKAKKIAFYVLHGEVKTVLPTLIQRLNVSDLHFNRDYEPYALTRDALISAQIEAMGVAVHNYKDRVIFEENDILSLNQTPYTVFTPYSKAWLKRFSDQDAARLEINWPSHAQPAFMPDFPRLQDIGFEDDGRLQSLGVMASSDGALERLTDFENRIALYHQKRDFPAIKGVSYLSVHLRFGTLSIRSAVRMARSGDSEGHRTWLNELIWRDFYTQLLWHFPQVSTLPFKPAYRQLSFPFQAAYLKAWQEGQTGYPIVDAAMRQLNQTGYMHNRLRMIVASFFCKDLLLDYRLGEAYFAEKLLDFDLASNNGGWQWAASTGCDAQPYFRIFNPVTQSQKFDSDGKFIRRYVPELATLNNQQIHAPWEHLSLLPIQLGKDYPFPIVNHDVQRKKALELYLSIRAS